MQQESLRAFRDYLIPLKTLKARVDAFAAECLPDFIYPASGDPAEARGFSFRPIEMLECFEARDLHAIDEDALDIPIVGFDLADGEVLHPYVFTRWARGQLLSHVGTREKWFASVSLEQQARELNERRHTFVKHKFRLMKAGDGARVVRGLVSSVYAEIADTEVMEAIIELLPDGMALRYHSGKTDRAFYAYIVSPQKITVGDGLSAYAGIVLKNSEVGYTSLWMIPTLWFPWYDSVISFVARAPFKRIHRGKVEDLKSDFAKALFEVSTVWAEMQAKLDALEGLVYADEPEAIAAMKTALARCGSSKLFAYRCEQAYQGARNRSHSGRTILDAVLKMSRRQEGEDATHDHSAVAGALLLTLVR